MWNKKYVFSLLILIFILFSCGNGKFKTIEITVKNEKFVVECARTPEEQRLGLMYRTEMGKQKGMLFIYPEYVKHPYWMKNTYLPLSIAFLSKEGEILDIKDMKPLSEALVESRFSYMYSLEVNRGTFERIGVKIGDFVVFPDGFR